MRIEADGSHHELTFAGTWCGAPTLLDFADLGGGPLPMQGCRDAGMQATKNPARLRSGRLSPTIEIRKYIWSPADSQYAKLRNIEIPNVVYA